jgi:hypothetical protein
MNSLNIASDAARRSACPVALVLAPRLQTPGYQRVLALHGIDVEICAPDTALADPGQLPACGLLLAETSGLADPAAASLIAFAAARRREGSEVVLLCPGSHVDFVGALLGTGALLLCDPYPNDVERALQDATRAVWRQHMGRDGVLRAFAAPAPAPASPCPWPHVEAPFDSDKLYWLDILSGLLTDLAVARQAGGSEGSAIAGVLERAVEQLLAALSDGALLDAVRDAPDLGAAELVRLAGALARRGR